MTRGLVTVVNQIHSLLPRFEVAKTLDVHAGIDRRINAAPKREYFRMFGRRVGKYIDKSRVVVRRFCVRALVHLARDAGTRVLNHTP